MNIDKLIAVLNMADPLQNSNWQERRVALDMAHKFMDSYGHSYASLGFSYSDAERIENQFSVGMLNESNRQSWGSGDQVESDYGETLWEAFFRRRNKSTGNSSDGYGNLNNYGIPYDSSCTTEYKAECDYQGAVPNWDGYNGE
jgi:hypothetical protein